MIRKIRLTCDSRIRTNLLFGDLSARSIPGCGSLGWEKTEKVALLLFSGTLFTTLRGIGYIHHYPDSRS